MASQTRGRQRHDRPAATDSLTALGDDFWVWRAATQPAGRDDVNRVPRPTEWAPDWSPSAIAARRRRLAEFEQRWRALASSKAPVPRQVDHCLLGTALARVRWELDGVRSWRRDPVFYVDQTVAALVEALIPPPPFGRQRAADIVARLRAIPETLVAARENLDEPVAPFARLAIADLRGIAVRLASAMAALVGELPKGCVPSLRADAAQAGQALEGYRRWLRARLPSMSERLAVGRPAFASFLRQVALLPYTPEQLVEMGRQEVARATMLEAFAAERARRCPQPTLAANAAQQSARAKRAGFQVRRFLEEHDLLSVPSQIPGYRYRPLPAYLARLHGFGEETDFGSIERQTEAATRWMPAPSQPANFWQQVMNRDPRPHLAHEGVPGHAFQSALGYRHPNPLRRRWYDSASNEGLATYSEELILQAGLLDDSPHAREAVYRFLRLRALRVEVDVRLATGGFTVDEAAAYLRGQVAIDARTAREEAASYAAAPGFAIGYLIGKLQITKFLADARRLQGAAFSLRDFHDFVWTNGNVPLVLQRWEYLGLRDEVDALAARS